MNLVCKCWISILVSENSACRVGSGWRNGVKTYSELPWSAHEYWAVLSQLVWANRGLVQFYIPNRKALWTTRWLFQICFSLPWEDEESCKWALHPPTRLLILFSDSPSKTMENKWQLVAAFFLAPWWLCSYLQRFFYLTALSSKGTSVVMIDDFFPFHPPGNKSVFRSSLVEFPWVLTLRGKTPRSVNCTIPLGSWTTSKHRPWRKPDLVCFQGQALLLNFRGCMYDLDQIYIYIYIFIIFVVVVKMNPC